MITGSVVAVCLGPGGIPKLPVMSAQVEAAGLEGDAHRYELHGGEQRAVCLVSVEDLRSMQAEGVRELRPGDFGENLVIGGIDFDQLRPGSKLQVGDVVLELTDVRSPCRNLKAIDQRLPDLMLGRTGFLAKVVEPGLISVRMDVRLVE